MTGTPFCSNAFIRLLRGRRSAASRAAAGRLFITTRRTRRKRSTIAAADSTVLFHRDRSINSGGTITDINPDLSAAKAGLAPGMKIVAVNGQNFTTEILRQAVAATRNGPAPIKLDVENANAKETYDINYQGGEKYPHLVRDNSKPDYLSAITKPR